MSLQSVVQALERLGQYNAEFQAGAAWLQCTEILLEGEEEEGGGGGKGKKKKQSFTPG